jgi:hypothetical protein
VARSGEHAARLASLRDLHASRGIDHKSAIVILRQHTQAPARSSNRGRDIPHADPTYENRRAPRGVRSYVYPEHRSGTQMCHPLSRGHGVGNTDENAAHDSGVGNHCACRTRAVYNTGHAPISLPLFTARGFRGRVGIPARRHSTSFTRSRIAASASPTIACPAAFTKRAYRSLARATDCGIASAGGSGTQVRKVLTSVSTMAKSAC